MSTTGVFSSRYAKKKKWKLNEGLQRAVMTLIQPGQSVVDVGAGIGKYVSWLQEEHQCEAVGVDGIPGVFELSGGLVHEVDFAKEEAGTVTSALCSKNYFDLCMCIEVMEHIPTPHIFQFLNNLADVRAELFLISCGTLGQRGHDHVSCHEPYWVANRLGRRHFVVDEERTEKAREVAGKGWDHKLLVFYRG